jgi:hypothetical protein
LREERTNKSSSIYFLISSPIKNSVIYENKWIGHWFFPWEKIFSYLNLNQISDLTLAMDFDVLDKILNHLERCQLENKPLQINIDEELLKILPLPRKLILDLLSDRSISTLFRLSDDQKILFYEKNVNCYLNSIGKRISSLFL